jgi:putative flippase GtrA
MKRRALRFAITGLGNTAVHAIVAVTLIKAMGVAAGLANACAFLTATAVSYVINTFWSFGARPTRDNALKFGVVTAAGFAMAAYLGDTAAAWGWPPLVGVLFVSALVAPTNFLMHHFWTYRDRRTQSPTGESPSRPNSTH